MPALSRGHHVDFDDLDGLRTPRHAGFSPSRLCVTVFITETGLGKMRRKRRICYARKCRGFGGAVTQRRARPVASF